MKDQKTFAVAMVLGTLLLIGLLTRTALIAGSSSKGQGNANGQPPAQSGNQPAAADAQAPAANVGQQNSGAIFTTDKDGTKTNKGVYAVKETVYLNGGPTNQNCGQAGLPDGDYYFQVTDPSGNVLLSQDTVSERQVRVQGGVISQYLGTTHVTSAGTCQAVTVALAPFNDTANPGGEYKVWMTSVAAYADGQGSFGFRPGDSKTDNFNVIASRRVNKRTGTIRGRTFRDAGANGVDDGDQALAGIEVSLKVSGSSSVQALQISDAGGYYVFGGLNAGTYEVCESLPQRTPSWLRTAPATPSGCYALTLNAGETLDYENFGNILLTEIGGRKVLDANANGSDDGEEQLAGFEISLAGNTVNNRTVALTATTGEDGSYRFADLLPGAYQLCENLPVAAPAWRQSFPEGCRTIYAAEGEVRTTENFGNYQFTEISGAVFNDHNADAAKDADDNGLAGFSVKVTGTAANGSGVTFDAQSDAQGRYSFAALLPGTYDVCVTPPALSPAWLQTVPSGAADCASFTLRSGQKAEAADFGMIRLSEISGLEFYDVNVNGLNDDQRSIAGWNIALAGTAVGRLPVTLNSLTGTDGRFTFAGLLPGAYSVSQVVPPASTGTDWVATTSLSSVQNRAEGDTRPLVSFGAVCLGSGGGKSIGYWTSKNGEALVDSGDLAALVALNLRTAAGSAFNPTSYANLKTWLTNATATNMAYMLSAHLTAAKLSVLNALADENALVLAQGAKGANAAGFMSLKALMTEADAELAANGLTPTGNAARAYQESLKNALEKANADKSFVQRDPAACAVKY